MPMVIPPLAIDRVIAQYHFEGSGYVALVCFGHIATGKMLDAIQLQIDLKREELKKYQAPAEGPDNTRPAAKGEG